MGITAIRVNMYNLIVPCWFSSSCSSLIQFFLLLDKTTSRGVTKQTANKMTTTYANIPWFNILSSMVAAAFNLSFQFCVLHLVRDLEISWEHLRILCNMLCALEWMHRRKNQTETLYCMLHLHLDSTLSCSVSVLSTDDAIIYGYLKSCSYMNKKKKMAHLIWMNRDHNWNISSHIAAERCNLHHIGARSGGIYTATRKKKLRNCNKLSSLNCVREAAVTCVQLWLALAREKKKLSRHM